MYTGCARENRFARPWKKALSLKKVPRVPGNMMIDCAKMIGITPAVLTRSGMCVLAPP